MRLAVTCSRAERTADVAVATALAAELRCPWLRRRERTVTRVIADEDLAGVVVVADGEAVWHAAGGGRFFYHPNMAVNRLHERAGGGLTDPLVTALELRPGDRVLDLTLGLGADALVVSHTVGPSGLVTGVEASAVVAALVRYGLATYAHKLAPAMRAIRVVHGDHRELLRRRAPLVTAGWDVMLFDPMFEHTVQSSKGLDGIRRLACYDPVDEDTILRARSLVRRRLAVKGRQGDAWFDRLRPDRVVQPKQSRIGYALFEAEGEESNHGGLG